MNRQWLQGVSLWLFSFLSIVCLEAVSEETVAKIEWSTDYQKARETAAAQHKPLLLLFTGSNWCSWCIRLEQEILSAPIFAQEIGKDFLFVKVDFPRGVPMDAVIKQQNDLLQKQFRVKGFPTVVILNEQGDVIGTTGYRRGGPENYAAYLKEMIRQ